MLELLAVRPLVAPGSKWHLHRRWFLTGAMDEPLAEGFAVAAKHRLYGCLDIIDTHRAARFAHRQSRWKDLFGATHDLLLHDLTSSHFEGEMAGAPKARPGPSRDKRSDCRQIVLAVVLTPEGFPLAYEIMPGNASGKATLTPFLQKIEAQYGKANRLWIMDRGIPTGDTLAAMRRSGPPVGLPGRHAPRPLGSVPDRLRKTALAKTARLRGGETARPRRRSLRARQEHRPPREGSGGAPAQAGQAAADPAPAAPHASASMETRYALAQAGGRAQGRGQGMVLRRPHAPGGGRAGGTATRFASRC